MSGHRQLTELAKPFKPSLIKAPPKGKYGVYVEHSTVTEKLLAVVGPFDFEVTEIILGDDGRIEGCLARLTVEIDGRRTTIVEVGDCENPSNWHSQGARLKDAASDAIKRCAMRLGVGLHLWSQDNFFLHAWLTHLEAAVVEPEGSAPSSPAGTRRGNSSTQSADHDPEGGEAAGASVSPPNGAGGSR